MGGYRSDDENYVSVECLYKRMTPKAVLVHVLSAEADVWVPLSIIHAEDEADITHHSPNEPIKLRIMQWFCRKNSIE